MENRKRDKRRRKEESQTESKGRKKGGKKGTRDKEMNKIRRMLMSIYSRLLRSPITLQVSSCDLGGFDKSGSPW